MNNTMIAYLAHSSEDKRYVEIVAKRLGRARAQLDSKSFPPGFDFRELIRKGLDKSKIFIFFASMRSVKSSWVRFEINEAEWQILSEQMGGAITIIIDDELKPGNLPKWMQRCLAITILNPKSAAHIIQNYMVQIGIQIEPIFVGREADMANFAKELIPDIEMESPRVLIAAGLEGIGRKTFSRHAIRTYLSMDMGPTFILEETDSIDSLYLLLVNETNEFTSRERLAEAIKTFRDLSDNEKGEEVARLLSLINRYNLMPIIVDKGPAGTFLDDNTNWYKEEWQLVLQGLNTHEDCYVLLIQPRLPYSTNLTERLPIPRIAKYKLGPLSNEAVELLLREGIRKTDIKATTEQIKEITQYIDGYPPAARFVMGFIKDYGIDILLADKGMLTGFLARQFENFIVKLGLSKKENEILRILEAEISLPFEAIRVVIDCSPPETAKLIRHLIDLNLVIPIDDEYIISSPIRVAVSHKLGILTKKDYSRIAKTLRKEFWSNGEELPKLSIVDTIIHALAYSNLKELDDFKDLILPTQLYKVARQKYNAKDWIGAEALARRALQLDNRLQGARVILFKALVRQRHWNQAEQVLEVIESEFRRERFYLRGFLEWKRGHHYNAVSWFRRGWEAGDQSLSILRDSAYCLFVLGEMGDAKFFIDLALQRTRNKYILDLAAQIAIFSDRIPETENYLAELKELDLLFYYNRRATLRCKQGRLPEALEDIEKACNTEYPRFEAIVQKIDILILLDRPEAEQEIMKIEPTFVERSDIQRGLWCKYYLQKGQWVLAESWRKKIWQKELPSFKDLRKAVLKQKTEDIMLSPLERKEAVAELSEVDVICKLPLLETDFEDKEQVTI